MDPYVEPVWRPFHTDYVTQLKQQLQAQLPADLYAVTESDVFVVDGGRRGRAFTPDAAAFGPSVSRAGDDRGATGTSTTVLPIRARVQRQPALMPHVAIREPRRGNRLVTAVELFSPTNKATARERAVYRDKRDAYLMAGVTRPAQAGTARKVGATTPVGRDGRTLSRAWAGTPSKRSKLKSVPKQ